MKTVSIIFTLICIANEAAAREQRSYDGISLAGSIMQTLAALLVVVGLILLFYYAASRLAKGGLPAGMSAKYIRVLETRFLAPKRSLLLLEVGGEYLLLSNSENGLHFIKQIDMLEEIEVLDPPGSEKFGAGNLHSKIIDLSAWLSRKGDAGKPERASAGKAA